LLPLIMASIAPAGKLIAAIDQGTTSTRVIIFDEHAKAVASHQMEHKQIYPQDGWCEHDPLEVLENTKTCLDAAVANLAKAGKQSEQVVGVGITNQRETTIVWDKHTGKPLHNAIVWLDLRTAELAAELEAEGGKDRFRATCGLPISTYFSAVKLLWLIRNKPEVAEAIAKGTALFGTVRTPLHVQILLADPSLHRPQYSSAQRAIASMRSQRYCGSCNSHPSIVSRIPRALPNVRSTRG
jgi:glycerol kinase